MFLFANKTAGLPQSSLSQVRRLPTLFADMLLPLAVRPLEVNHTQQKAQRLLAFQISLAPENTICHSFSSNTHFRQPVSLLLLERSQSVVRWLLISVIHSF